MILGLLPKSTRTKRPAPKVPEETRIYAIGDIHGSLDLLEALQDSILEDAAKAPDLRHVVVYLGDYVDRGPDSKAVIDRLLKDPLDALERVYLIGNHEVFLLQFLEDKSTAMTWLMNGGTATCTSYGVDPTMAPDGVDALAWLQGHLEKALPARHKKFLQNLKLHHAEGDYLFVHAGIRPGVALEDQDPEDMLWIREPFLSSRADFGAVVVHGHTPSHEPEVRANRIGVDTGACFGGHLTALVLESDSQRFLQV